MINESVSELYSLDGVFQIGNVAGIYEDIRLIPAEWVEYIDIQNNSSVLDPGAIKLKKGAYWVMILAAYKSAILDIFAKVDRNGMMYVSRLNLEVAFIRPSTVEFFRRYSKLAFIALVKDRNGYARLVGTQNEPLLLQDLLFSAGVVAGKNTNQISLSGLHKQPTLFVSAVDDAVAYISSTRELVDRNSLVISEIEALLRAISGYKEMLLNYEPYRLRVFTYIFTKNSAEFISNRKVIDLFDIPNDSTIDVLGASLNGISINARLVNDLENMSNWDDCFVIKDLIGYRAYFNFESIDLLEDNVFRILVKIA